MSKHRDIARDHSHIKRIGFAAALLALIAFGTALGLTVTADAPVASSPRYSPPAVVTPEPTPVRDGEFTRPPLPTIGAEGAWEPTDGPVYPERAIPDVSRCCDRVAPMPKGSAVPITPEEEAAPVPEVPPPVETPEPEVIPPPTETVETPPPVEIEEPPVEEEEEPKCGPLDILDELLGICITDKENENETAPE